LNKALTVVAAQWERTLGMAGWLILLSIKSPTVKKYAQLFHSHFPMLCMNYTQIKVGIVGF